MVKEALSKIIPMEGESLTTTVDTLGNDFMGMIDHAMKAYAKELI
jgi:hypothetical protein